MRTRVLTALALSLVLGACGTSPTLPAGNDDARPEAAGRNGTLSIGVSVGGVGVTATAGGEERGGFVIGVGHFTDPQGTSPAP